METGFQSYIHESKAKSRNVVYIKYTSGSGHCRKLYCYNDNYLFLLSVA
jgi:hypothetical protein